MRLQVEVRAADLTPVGLLQGWTSCVLVPRFNGIGTWTISVPNQRLTGEAREALIDGGGVRITDAERPGDRPLLAGPLEEDGDTLSVGDEYGGTLQLAGVSDEHVLEDPKNYPNPAVALASQAPDTDDVRGPAPGETVMKGYVDANAGPGALAARQVTGLVIATDLARGASVKETARYRPLIELARSISTRAGLGFRIDQTGTQRVFDTYVPQLRDGVLLSPAAGTVRGATTARVRPRMTRAIVLGKTTVLEVTTAASLAAETAYGRRIEDVVDRSSTDDATVMQQAGEEALAKAAATGAMTVTAVDTEQTQFRRDYDMGDQLPRVHRGVELVDVVHEVKITALPGGARVEPLLGPREATTASDDQWARLEELERDVRALKSRR